MTMSVMIEEDAVQIAQPVQSIPTSATRSPSSAAVKSTTPAGRVLLVDHRLLVGELPRMVRMLVMVEDDFLV